jgi:hypothetical protein
MPNKAMKPTDAGTDKYSPVTQRATIPPTIANGILLKINNDCRTERKVENKSKKISPKATGTTTAKRAAVFVGSQIAHPT